MKRDKKVIPCGDNHIIRSIFGSNDRNLRILEKETKVKISLCNEGILLHGERDKLEYVSGIIERLRRFAKQNKMVDEDELKDMLKDNFDYGRDIERKEDICIEVPSKKRYVYPKTPGQKEYIEAIRRYDIVFSLGPAGTGKTYLAMAMAVNYLTTGGVSRIILTRPAIEAGESLGFLPGDVNQKLGPYLKPLYDALYEMISPTIIEEYLETGVIEIAPLAYMRGRTLNNAFIILDEAQNCTSEQLKMFLTRLGFDSKTVITGDMTQSDLPGGNPKGLMDALRILKPIKGIKFMNLTKKDVVRHPLIQKIVEAYEDYYKKEKG